MHDRDSIPAMPSRRDFLAATAAVATAIAAERGPILAYAGGYSVPGGSGRGKGITLFEMNPATGALTEREVFPNAASPTYLVLNTAGTRLYSANLTSDSAGSVSAYEIERPSGRLKLINAVPSMGAGPCYASLHPSGKWLLVANFYGGTSAVLPIGANGELGEASDVQRHEGVPGPLQATNAPPGSFAQNAHDRAHSHMIQTDRQGRFVLAADIGLDRIFVWRFDSAEGKLIPNEPPSVALPPGDGPRHFAFHPNGRILYSLQEVASTLVAFDYDGATGRLRQKQMISTLPPGFAGTNLAAEVAISQDARFVYASNRLHDSVSWFSIAGDGTLRFEGNTATRGDFPRLFTFDPAGDFLYCCNEHSDAITSFRVNRETGALVHTGQYTPLGTPTFLGFLPSGG
jgi:6-phosphogluconolactonase